MKFHCWNAARLNVGDRSGGGVRFVLGVVTWLTPFENVMPCQDRCRERRSEGERGMILPLRPEKLFPIPALKDRIFQSSHFLNFISHVFLCVSGYLARVCGGAGSRLFAKAAGCRAAAHRENRGVDGGELPRSCH